MGTNNPVSMNTAAQCVT